MLCGCGRFRFVVRVIRVVRVIYDRLKVQLERLLVSWPSFRRNKTDTKTDGGYRLRTIVRFVTRDHFYPMKARKNCSVGYIYKHENIFNLVQYFTTNTAMIKQMHYSHHYYYYFFNHHYHQHYDYHYKLQSGWFFYKLMLYRPRLYDNCVKEVTSDTALHVIVVTRPPPLILRIICATLCQLCRGMVEATKLRTKEVVVRLLLNSLDLLWCEALFCRQSTKCVPPAGIVY